MTRRAYLALCRPANAGDAAARADDIGRALTADGWTLQAQTGRVAVWIPPGAATPVRVLPKTWGVIIGDLHPALATSPEPCARRDVAAAARDLARTAWGGFVALLHDPGDGRPHAYRDPGGALGCQTWSLGEGLDVVASDLTVAPEALRPRRLALDWDRIAAYLAVPTSVTTPPLFTDLAAVGPGQLRAVAGAGASTTIWSPVEAARQTAPDLLETQAELVRRVDRAVDALVGAHARVVMELSGGLDSSILAGALGATGHAGRVTHWLNYRDVRQEADESRFAQAVADRLGVGLHIQPYQVAPLEETALAEIAGFSRPAIGAVDAVRDRFETALLREAGATGVISGQGGDGVFFQFPTALVAADEFARRSWRAWASPVLADVARRTRQSVWAVAAQVRAAKRGREARPAVASSLLSAPLAAAAGSIMHEWVAQARASGLPPGKVLHIEGIALNHFYYEPSRRLAQADILLPLLSQPVIELCLAIPTPDLAGGSYDRPFARAAFAKRLPQAVIDRRAKGNLSAHVARFVAASAEMLRPYLIDGCLAEAGLLDRAKLRLALDPQALMSGQARFPMHVLNAAAVEAWVRHWQGRVPDAPQAPRRRG
jgi:asparagine synthase (glutamine-hydrolysing)